MKYINIAGMECSRIVLGAGEYGGFIDENAALELMDSYIERGGNVIDTAEVYGDWCPGAGKSPSEKCVGRYLKSHGKGNLIISTKGAHYRLADPNRTSRVRPECIKEDIDKSLQNLCIETIDLYWLHRDDPEFPVETLMDCLFECQDKGFIRHIGASNWSFERIERANLYAESCGRKGFEADQIGYAYMKNYVQAGVNEDPDLTMLYFDEQKDTDYCIKVQMPIFAYSSQANGFITKYLSGGTIPDKVRRSYDSEDNRKRAERAGKIAKEIGCSAEAVGLGYLFSRPFRVCAIAGPKNMDQLSTTMEAGDLSLTNEQISFLEKDG